jgi:hypothetical protein
MGRYDEREERVSWSEIDKLKDRSNHVTREKPEYRKKPSAKEEWAKKHYLKEIDKLFSGAKEETAAQKSARGDIARSYGTSKFHSAVDHYLEYYGFPTDWSTLILMIDHKDQGIVVKTLMALKGKMNDCSAAEQQGIKSKIKILAMTAEDEEVRELAEEIVRELE